MCATLSPDHLLKGISIVQEAFPEMSFDEVCGLVIESFDHWKRTQYNELALGSKPVFRFESLFRAVATNIYVAQQKER